MTIKALRGAAQLTEDTPEQVRDSVKQLLDGLLKGNSIDESQVISVFFSQTKDLRSANPATESRKAGYGGFSYFCLQELDVDGSLEKMIRVLIHIYCSIDQELRPVYVGGAEKLRPDIFPGNR